LQNESVIVPTDTKLELLDGLVAAGMKDIEVGAFVSPRWVPQMADTGDLFQRLSKHDDVRYWALIPNRRGLERALDVDVRHVATFLSASETHNMKNLNRTIRESLSGLQKVIAMAKSEGLTVRSYISTVFGCPYEGEVSSENTVRLAKGLLDAGADQIALGDTTGMGNPEQVKRIVDTLLSDGISLENLAIHLHDTRGTALTNAYAAWQSGVRCFDGSVGGIGGCPYAPGASGNAATEDLVYLFEQLNCSTGLSLDELCASADFMEEQLGRKLSSRLLKVWQSKQSKQSMQSVSKSA
jgi:hydroxymethylglutaryl-CoA lyase